MLWAPGYSPAQLDDIQDRYSLAFPPDLLELYSRRRPAKAYDWMKDEIQIRSMLAWPLEGLLFDVEDNSLWLSAWGERPDDRSARAAIVSTAVDAAPKLIPLYSHRYLPATPSLAGNPVLSVYQSDIIVYGANLTDYFEREFGGKISPLQWPVRRIAFWSHFIDGEP